MRSHIREKLKANAPKFVKNYYRSFNRKSLDGSVLIFVLDSCRYDTFADVYQEEFPAKNVRKAYSPAHWTIPSHESIVRGFLPHGDFENPLKILEPNFGVPLPVQFKYSFGSTALPYLSSSSVIKNHFHRHFDDYDCQMRLDSADEVLEVASQFIPDKKNFFGLVNFGETHSPYRNHSKESLDDLLGRVDEGKLSYNELHERQKESAKFLINKIEGFIEDVPEDTLVIVTSDHGELFGERGGFGHNPHKRASHDDRLYEVPLIYWHN